MKSLNSFVKSIGKWQVKTFGRNINLIDHLAEEVKELKEHPNDGEEMADIFVILVEIAYIKGKNLEKEVKRKMKINRKRKWNKPNKEGIIYHEK